MIKEFFGFGGYQRSAEGFLSWQHLTFVSCLMVTMVVLSILLGNKTRTMEEIKKNKVLVVSAIMIDSFELFKIIILCIRHGDALHWLYELPLFLCSIQLIVLPLAAFSKGRIKEAALDFVMIFGVLGALLGTYGAGNNYAVYPVLGFDNVVSGITHAISGFASLYIMISRMASMKKKNMPMTLAILTAFCSVAYPVNLILDYNYMFLIRGDGTPYEILYSLLNGNPVLYPLSVVLLFFIYMALFYYVYYLVTKPHIKNIPVLSNGN